MRLIDADALMEAMRKFEKEAENVMTCPSWWSAYQVIKEQPAAYNVDAVVEALEKAFPINPYPNEFSNGRSLAIKTAIDIVRKGGAL